MYTVYRITNKANGRTYIGMTKRTLHQRLGKHLASLRGGDHPNVFMLADFNAHQWQPTIEVLEQHEFKEDALIAEKIHINKEDNPYNIMRGQVGDGNGFWGGYLFPSSVRSYIYEEIARRPHLSIKQVKERFGCSGALVSMIRSGIRSAPEPQTSFKDCYSCPFTEVEVPRKIRSDVKRYYEELA